MFHLSFRLVLLVGLLVLITGCRRERGCTDPTALNYNPDAFVNNGDCLYELPVPTTYTFLRYDLSTVRNVTPIAAQTLIADLYHLVQQLGSNANLSVAYADSLLPRYAETAPDLSILLLPSSEANPDLYSGFGAVASLQSQLNNTYGANEDLIEWLAFVQAAAQNPDLIYTPQVHTSAEGLDLSELIHKTLLGAVLYYQGTQLLNTLSSANNTDLVGGTNYTAAELAFDRAFAYFGASIDLKSYTDAQLLAQPYQDTNNNGDIDYTSEYNFHFPTEAARRDVAVGSRDFTETIFNAFLAGRTAITNKEDSLRFIYSSFIVDEWERLIAASAIHHLNKLPAEMAEVGTNTTQAADLNRDWSAMRGYLLALRYNVNKEISTADLNTILGLTGSTPVYAENGSTEYSNYVSNLFEVRTLLQTTYGFSETEVLGW